MSLSAPDLVTGPADADLLDRIDWDRVSAQLDDRGFATIGPLLDGEQCRVLRNQFDQADVFRSHIKMSRHGFGRGEYKYFANPLPRVVSELRHGFYKRLVPVANHWRDMLGQDERFPVDYEAFLQRCHAAGQQLPTPLLLRYGPEDYNCLHQDLYGEHVFPLQVAILLSEPETEFSGGEFVLTEQRPRMQSRAEVIRLAQGEAVVFAVNERPVAGKRGVYRVRMRHGVSRVLSGERHVAGIILHDAA